MAFASYGSPDVESALKGTARVPFDPLRYCVYTTIALLTWLVSAPVMMMATSGIGFWMYARAIRGGLDRSRCVLRSPRLVLLYLGAVFALGAGATVYRVIR